MVVAPIRKKGVPIIRRPKADKVWIPQSETIIGEKDLIFKLFLAERILGKDNHIFAGPA